MYDGWLVGRIREQAMLLAKMVQRLRSMCSSGEINRHKSCVPYALILLKQLFRNPDLTQCMFEIHVKDCADHCIFQAVPEHVPIYNTIALLLKELMAMNVVTAKALQYDRAIVQMRAFHEPLVRDPNTFEIDPRVQVVYDSGEMVRPVPIPLQQLRNMAVIPQLMVCELKVKEVEKIVIQEVEKIVYVDREVIRGIIIF